MTEKAETLSESKNEEMSEYGTKELDEYNDKIKDVQSRFAAQIKSRRQNEGPEFIREQGEWEPFQGDHSGAVR